MKTGGGARKGAEFERKVCKDLSLALSGDKRSDFFWRSAMSGGRATIVNRRGEGPRNSAQLGDVCAVDQAGQWLTDTFFIECKFRKDLELANFLLDDIGYLARYWATAKREAQSHGRRPLVFARENYREPLVLMHPEHIRNLGYRKAHPDGVLSPPIMEVLEAAPLVVFDDGNAAIFAYDHVIEALASMYLRNTRPKRERLPK